MKCQVQKKIQYHNKRLAEKAMLGFFQSKGEKAFGSYQCPYCTYWHITSQYDNRSPQSLHEFRQYEDKRRRKRRLKEPNPLLSVPREVRQKRAKILKGSLTLEQQREIFKTFTPTVHKSEPVTWRSRIMSAWKKITYQTSSSLLSIFHGFPSRQLPKTKNLENTSR